MSDHTQQQDEPAKRREAATDLARRHDVSEAAAAAVLDGLIASGGGQTQFNHPDLGGMGQWSRGGMTMVGDMFNDGLKAKVAALCADAAKLVDKGDLGSAGAPSTSGQGEHWPAELGRPGTSGAQNGVRYAVFPDKARLAVEDGGKVTVYDIGDHRISGVTQQQGSSRSLNFTSQHGPVSLDQLQVVGSPGGEASDGQAAEARHHDGGGDHEAIFAKLEGLKDLHGKGVLADDEFNAKKAELLARL